MMFIHGFASGREDWDAPIAQFVDTRRCIAPSLRAHGIGESASPRGTEVMSIETLAADCVALAKSLGLTRIIVAGHSMGCRIGLEIHRQAPALISGLVLVDGSNMAGDGVESAVTRFTESVRSIGYGAVMTAFFGGMFTETADEKTKARYVARALTLPPADGIELMCNMIRWDGDHAASCLAAVDVPLLLIQSTTMGADRLRRPVQVGEGSKYTDFAAANAQAPQIEFIPDIGHYTMVEAPDAVTNRIMDWMTANQL